jgi:hypothetical protein
VYGGYTSKSCIHEPTSFFGALAYSEIFNRIDPMWLLAHESKIRWKDSEKVQIPQQI